MTERFQIDVEDEGQAEVVTAVLGLKLGLAETSWHVKSGINILWVEADQINPSTIINLLGLMDYKCKWLKTLEPSNS